MNIATPPLTPAPVRFAFVTALAVAPIGAAYAQSAGTFEGLEGSWAQIRCHTRISLYATPLHWGGAIKKEKYGPVAVIQNAAMRHGAAQRKHSSSADALMPAGDAPER